MSTFNFRNKEGNWEALRGGVESFKSRAGHVIPRAGDYTAEMVGARPNTWMPNIAEVGGVNPNLLPNWYFANPVNQRGLTEYTTAGYTIDSLYLLDGTLHVNTDDGYITFTGSGKSGTGMEFRIESSGLIGKTVTFSVLSDGELQTTTMVIPNVGEVVSGPRLLLNGIEWPVRPITEDGVVKIMIRKDGSTASFNLTAAKLEVGNIQTLAHKESNIWVLNEIPDYNKELLKCCMSTADPDDEYANNKKTPAAIGAASIDDAPKDALTLTSSTIFTGDGTDVTEDVAKAVAPYIDALPNITTSDNGKFLRVVNGAWSAATVRNAKEVNF